MHTPIQNLLLGRLIGLARASFTNPKTPRTDAVLLQGLCALHSLCPEQMEQAAALAAEEKALVAPGCAACTARCGNTDDYDTARLWQAEPAVRGGKLILLAGLCGLAGGYLARLPKLGEDACTFFYRGLYTLAEDWNRQEIDAIVGEAAEAAQYLWNS